MQDHTSADYRHGMDVRGISGINRPGKTYRFLLCEYSEPGAEMSHEVYHAVSWHRTMTAAANKRRKQDHPHVVLVFDFAIDMI